MKISLSIVAVGHALRAFPYEGSSTSESSEGGFAKIAPFFFVSGTCFWVGFFVCFLCFVFWGGGAVGGGGYGYSQGGYQIKLVINGR